MENRDRWNESAKLAALIDDDRNVLFVLQRFGIRLGFGDKSVGEVCRMYNLSPQLFLLVCTVYTQPDCTFSLHMLSSTDLPDIIKYLHNSHSLYTDSALPDLERKVREVTACCEEKNRKILLQFFDDYRKEVNIHFDYEENTVLPYVGELLDGRRADYSIGQFEDNHSNIEDKLHDLKSIIIKYLPDDGATDRRYDLTNSILLLADDFSKHTLIEDKILVPLVLKLECNE